jgi:hypothetical protein
MNVSLSIALYEAAQVPAPVDPAGQADAAAGVSVPPLAQSHWRPGTAPARGNPVKWRARRCALCCGMAGNLSPAAQGRIAELQLMEMKVQRVHGMVELYATAKTNPDQYVLPMTRQFTRLKQELMGMGLDSMSQLAGPWKSRRSEACRRARKRGSSGKASAR